MCIWSELNCIFSCVFHSVVCEVLPTICASKEVNCAPKQYYKWLQKAIEFYTVYASQPAWKSDQKGAKGPPTPLLSPGIKSAGAKGHGFGFSELVRPWESLHRLLAMIANKCGWDSKFVPDEERFVNLHNLHNTNLVFHPTLHLLCYIHYATCTWHVHTLGYIHYVPSKLACPWQALLI